MTWLWTPMTFPIKYAMMHKNKYVSKATKIKYKINTVQKHICLYFTKLEKKQQ